jgi:hypothetical protein
VVTLLARLERLGAGAAERGPRLPALLEGLREGARAVLVAAVATEDRLWLLTVLPVSFVATVPVQLTAPVVSARLIGMVPIVNIGSGGQWWLVGYCTRLPWFVSSATHGSVSFGPPMQVPPLQIGHGWMPGMVSLGSVAVSP